MAIQSIASATAGVNVEITYKGTKTVTTDFLADFYRVDSSELLSHLKSKWFKEGEHYFVADSSLPGFGINTGDILWTDRGAHRLSMPLDSDAAWQVFDDMVEHTLARSKATPARKMSGADFRAMAAAIDAGFPSSEAWLAYLLGE